MISDVEQIAHVARLAVLAMCARGVAAVEFESCSDITAVHICVSRAPENDSQLVVDLEYQTDDGHIIGGISL